HPDSDLRSRRGDVGHRVPERRSRREATPGRTYLDHSGRHRREGLRQDRSGPVGLTVTWSRKGFEVLMPRTRRAVVALACLVSLLTAGFATAQSQREIWQETLIIGAVDEPQTFDPHVNVTQIGGQR